MVLTESSSLNKLMVKLKEKIFLGEGIRYSVPDLWNCFGYNGQEKFVDEKGITLVNPYKFYFSCINDFIIPKKDTLKDYNKSISQITDNFNEKNGYLGGDWIIDSSVYTMDIGVSTSWDHNGSGFLEDCNENGFKETGTFLKTIALLPLLKKMGITTLYLLPITKFSIEFKAEEFAAYCIVKRLLDIDIKLKDTMLGEDFTVEEEFRALIEACHILDIRIIMDIIPKINNPMDYIKRDLFKDNEINELLWSSFSNIIPYYQSNFGIDGAVLDLGDTLPLELVHRIIQNSRSLDKDFCFITEEIFENEVVLTRRNGCNMISHYNVDLRTMISEGKTFDYIYSLGNFKEPQFVCAESLETTRVAADGGKIMSKFLSIINQFLPNSVSIITSGMEVYETKPFNASLELSWIGDCRWDIPDTLEAITKIKNQFSDTFANPTNFFRINFESPYTTAIGLAYIIEGKRWRSSDNVIIIVGNTDLYNSREYTLFLENIRYESGNGSKRAWLLYSQNEWSHDIYDFDHRSDLQLSFMPGEVKILIM
jgi:hypothetical protein